MEAGEPHSISPVHGLDDSQLSDEIRWVFSNSWRGNTGSEDWTFCPTAADLRRAEDCLDAVSIELRAEAARCVSAGNASSAYYSYLRRLTFVHETAHAWYLNVSGICGIEPEAGEMWHAVLDAYWRQTPEHHAFEKMLRDRPEAKARKKAYDAKVKKTPEAREANRLAAKAARARKKGLVAA